MMGDIGEFMVFVFFVLPGLVLSLPLARMRVAWIASKEITDAIVEAAEK